MPASKAQQKAVNKYMKENYDRFLATFKPKGRLGIIKAHAAIRGESANAFINRAIDQAIAQDNSGATPEAAEKGLESTQGAGVVYLPSETVDAAQRAAEAAEEDIPQFISRAVETQAKRDEIGRRMKGGKSNE